MLIYGVGDHLLDMIAWHPELIGRIERLFDKDPCKIGSEFAATGTLIESVRSLQELPAGSYVVIAAIRYFDEIFVELKLINSGLLCLNIDDAYDMVLQQPWEASVDKSHPYSVFVRDLARRLREAREGVA